MRKLSFMSAEHVAEMNRLLDASAAVHEASAALDRLYVLHYDLSDGPRGEQVHWTMTFASDGVRFGLEAPDRADIVVAASYDDAIEASRASREGREPRTKLQMDGDPAVLQTIAPTFAAAQATATIDVEFDR